MTDPAQSAPRDDPQAAVAETLEEAVATPASASGGATYASAKTAHEIIKAQKSRLELEQKRGELIERSKVVAHVFMLARQERDSWLNWPARVAATIAAELGADPHATQQALERNVRAHLAELSDIKPDFR